MMELERQVLGSPIRVMVQRLDSGWDVAVFGGMCSHVGAVSLSDAAGRVQTMERPLHRESVLSARWAGVLAAALGEEVCVRCGIHYDALTQEQLACILTTCEELLTMALQVMQQEEQKQ